MRLTHFVITAAFTFLYTISFGQNVVMLAANKDNTIYSESDNSNAIGDYLFAGNNSAKNTRRALFFFRIDIPQVPIPESQLVINEVILHVKPNRTTGGSQVFTLHRLLSDWGESTSNANSAEGTGALPKTGDATWNYASFTNISWVKGGNFVPTPSATFTISDFNDQNIATKGMLDDVKFWLINPGQNFGWILKGNEINSQTAYRFDSRENASGLGPRLEVHYTIVNTLTTNSENNELDKIVYDKQNSTIEYRGSENAPYLQIMDTFGKNLAAVEKSKISTSHFAPGIYIVKCYTNSGTIHKRFYLY